MYLSTDADEMYQYNMLPLLEMAKAVTNLWVNRNLSLIGTILITNLIGCILVCVPNHDSWSISKKILKANK